MTTASVSGSEGVELLDGADAHGAGGRGGGLDLHVAGRAARGPVDRRAALPSPATTSAAPQWSRHRSMTSKLADQATKLGQRHRSGARLQAARATCPGASEAARAETAGAAVVQSTRSSQSRVNIGKRARSVNQIPRAHRPS